jgi:glutaconate CoA-transferase subunit A
VEVLAQGIGAIFTDPDADKARAFFRKKSRALKPKVMSVKEAVEKFVHDGDYLVTGGFGANRIPAAVVHEILRQGRKKMGFAGHTATRFQISARVRFSTSSMWPTSSAWKPAVFPPTPESTWRAGR